jgi:hypothetical protein
MCRERDLKRAAYAAFIRALVEIDTKRPAHLCSDEEWVEAEWQAKILTNTRASRQTPDQTKEGS